MAVPIKDKYPTMRSGQRRVVGVRHLETRKRITKCKRYKDGLKSVLSKTRLVPKG
jgi:hypothetical protein